MLANDNDPFGQGLTVINAVPASNQGNASHDGQNITFTPFSGFTGTARIQYTIRDAQGRTSQAELTVNVSAAPTDPPQANPDSAASSQDGTIWIGVLNNDTGDGLTVIAASSNNGDVDIVNSNEIRFSPDPGFSGSTTISYTIRDSLGRTAGSIVNVTVTPNSPDPQANPDSATTDQDGTIWIGVLNNDTGDGITIVNATTNGGSVTIEAAGDELRFSPLPGFSGKTQINYTIRDSIGRTSSSIVTVTVNAAAGPPPQANPDSAQANTGSDVWIGALNNDTGDRITILNATTNAGTVRIEGSNLIFTPNSDASGTVTINYTIRDSSGRTSSSIVTVTVNA